MIKQQDATCGFPQVSGFSPDMVPAPKAEMSELKLPTYEARAVDTSPCGTNEL
ncbi:hypothetical protein [Limnohabitans sp. T6-5]|uniref:hypothetical protein n=1 Tax=Limnohabitans sp. T6-5 TaxID=1100724 RepID=UPI001304C4CC|nr:hypothetical protein [Limnohabitans sp. T6-5]